MFGFLKKKISETIERISGKAREEPATGIQPVSETTAQVERVIEPQPMQARPAPPLEKMEEPKEIVEPEEEKKIIIEQRLEVEIKKGSEKKIGLLEKIKKAVVESKIEEDDLSEILDDLKIGMLENDVALEVAEKICADLKAKLVGKSIKRGKEEEAVNEAFKSTLLGILEQDQTSFEERIRKIKSEKGFALILFLGFNGSGKTTTLAKIADRLKNSGLSCVFAAGDTWRAASIEQLETHGSRLG
ncbi:MAG: signal recognition particle receptor subunit alpha, partial [Candidatus Aenigmatarchaeota archaeon]